MFCYHLLYQTDNTTLRTWIKQVSIKQGQSPKVLQNKYDHGRPKLLQRRQSSHELQFNLQYSVLTPPFPFRPCRHDDLFISKKLLGGGPFNLRFIIFVKDILPLGQAVKYFTEVIHSVEV